MEGMVHFDLKPLEPDAIHRFLEQQTHAAHIDANVAQRVIGLAEGNPLFALEMLRHLEREGSIVMDGSGVHVTKSWDATSLPGRFHELVTCRLADLTEDQRALLDAAAVDGREFDGEGIEAVLDRPLLEILRELQRLYRRRNLIEPHGDGYRFTSGARAE